MKKPLIIWVSALTLLASATLLFAQTTTGSSLITQMKAATHAFTLTADLNSGATGLESSPLVGKRTGDMLSAGEYNRILELVGQGGGGSSNTLLNSPVTVDELTLLPTWKQVRSIDLSTKISIPSGSTHAILNIHCGVCSGNPGACNSPNNPESITVTRMDGKTMCRAYSGLLKSGSASIDSYNWDMDTNTTYIALENDGKTIKYNVEQNNNGDGEQGHVEILGFVTNGTSGGTGGGSGGAGKSGSLCGWVVDSSITGAGAGDTALVMCDGHNPRISCPSGYTKRDIMDIGAVAVTYYSRISTCVSNGGGTGGGSTEQGYIEPGFENFPKEVVCTYNGSNNKIKFKLESFYNIDNPSSAMAYYLTASTIDRWTLIVWYKKIDGSRYYPVALPGIVCPAVVARDGRYTQQI